MNREAFKRLDSKIEHEGGICPYLMEYAGPTGFKDTPLYKTALLAHKAMQDLQDEYENLCVDFAMGLMDD